ncbi:competence protein CoiA family protein [Flavobacterium sp.]|uniref:competence protein CoiA n=1 Tax=Flavobacterium sp. TaxID=239 RepID=UPI0025BC4AB3|nr:competence protein CoiA family protein [Flavobacterium sp.]MBA4153955.1 competence protein [Flavobacterium sp.]
MHFALLGNNRIEAQPKLNGLCSCCSKPVIAKCGTRKIWHWAHKSKTDCDNWWEPETEWHRTWKNNYSADWQEISLLNKRTGEKHIADVRTVHNLVIEFQHSHINPQERTSREQFYKNMVWVVDGTRLKRDYPRFLKEWKSDGISEVHQTDKSGIFKVWFPEFCFPEHWLKSSVPVIFDFRGDGSMDDSEGLRNTLYCLFPQFGRHARVAKISRKAFIKATTNGEWTLRVLDFINEFRIQDEIELRKQQQTMPHSSNKIIYTWRGIPLIGGYKKNRKRL